MEIKIFRNTFYRNRNMVNSVDIFHNICSQQFGFVRPAAYYYDWERELAHHRKEELDDTMNYHTNHIVNLTMGFKYPAMLSYFYQDKDYEALSVKGIRSAEKYHGVATGAINGDEHLSGNSPSQGAELCSIVEYMFSLQTMTERFGNPWFADKLERLAYNALPATITEDFMAHQYLQQANQVVSSKAKRNWFNNDDEANIFGLEPNFGCCTANMHQGWPKFVQSLWYLEDGNTVTAMVFAPSCLNTRIGGKAVCIHLRTDYPFKPQIVFQVEKAENLSLKIRVPGWCKEFSLSLNGERIVDQDSPLYDKGFLSLKECVNGGDELLFLPRMEVHTSTWFRNSLAVERGPLVYALDIKERWRVLREIAGVKDYEIYPESPWNYAIGKNAGFRVTEGEVGEVPFSKEEAPVWLETKGKKVEDWELENNSAGTLPVSPVAADAGEEEIRLLPYGCTKLRITQFPYYEEQS